MSLHRTCCCGPCTSSYRVFIPCSGTFPNREIRPVALTLDQLAECGFSEDAVYLYDPAVECDPFCGQWVCRNDADAEENRCHPDAPFANCPDCAPWEDDSGPPYREIRPAEMPAFCARFTEMGPEGCCDDLCPDVDCGFGDIIPTDCLAENCYDPSLLTWSVAVTGSQSQQGISGHGYTWDFVSVSAANATSTIVGGSLEIEFDVSLRFQTAPSGNAPANCADPANCTPPADPPGCICGDPDPCDVFPDVFDYGAGRFKITVPCMASPTGTFTGSSGIVPAVYCGGLSASTSMITRSGSTTFQHPIGWNGNGMTFQHTGTALYNFSQHPHLAETLQSTSPTVTPVQGSCTFQIELTLSLPARPATCPPF